MTANPSPQTQSPKAAAQPLALVVGNHMHWSGMQWLWGYDVMPGSVQDMLDYRDATGAKVCVNFDGICYEKLAAEAPDTLAQLRAGIADETLEPVGGTYAQPYGQFIGGESFIRHLTFGIETIARQLGVRPRIYWEEEFSCFPQLPQLLRLAGFEGACLFFQWTWHTPELPNETVGLIEWEGIDGSSLPALPRNALNIHQWPEEFDKLLDSGAVESIDRPNIVQWLELMPSQDWMCRSELLTPKMVELMQDERVDLQPARASDLIRRLVDEADGSIPKRRYTVDDMWHGLSIGKNGDRFLRTSDRVERRILSAEALSTLAGTLGRPYAGWDVYPIYEIDEAWRQLLAAQHHDNHECEGFCGFVGYSQFGYAGSLADEVIGRTLGQLADRVQAKPGEVVVFNPLGHAEVGRFTDDQGISHATPEIPAFGLTAFDPKGCPTKACTREPGDDSRVILRDGDLAATFDPRRGLLIGIDSPLGKVRNPDGLLSEPWMGRDKKPASFVVKHCDVDTEAGRVTVRSASVVGDALVTTYTLNALRQSVDVAIRVEFASRPEPGMNAALQVGFSTGDDVAAIRTDAIFSAEWAKGCSKALRKYPEGDWMTTPQWYETIDRPIHARQLIDLMQQEQEAASGLLILHDGTQQYLRSDEGVHGVLCAYDPWDGDRFEPWAGAYQFRLIPHEALSDAQRLRAASVFRADVDGWPSSPCRDRASDYVSPQRPRDLSAEQGLVRLMGEEAGNVLFTSVSRRQRSQLFACPGGSATALGAVLDAQCLHPVFIRLVESSGSAAGVVLCISGPVGQAYLTNLLGEQGEPLAGEYDPERDETSFALSFKPREIKTIVIDMLKARKIFRDLDAKREVWAGAHHV